MNFISAINFFSSLFLVVTIILFPASAFSKTFQKALSGYQYQFPRDHAAHPGFKTEWWYYTGHLQAKNGRQFGYELTFFRAANPSDTLPENTQWAVNEVYLTHFAISDIRNKRFLFQEKLARPGANLAGASTTGFHVWNHDWFAMEKHSLKQGAVSKLQPVHHLQASTQEMALNLTVRSEKAPVIHGQQGISQKASCLGCASHYISLTRLNTAGTLKLGNESFSVSGLSWMDHEFGSNQLAGDQVGWDWFSIQLDNNTELMLYLLRRKDGSLDPNSSGTFVENHSGQSRHLSLKDFQVTTSRTWKSPQSQAVYPMDWTITLPSQKLTLSIQSLMSNQELLIRQTKGLTYWEGACSVTGTQQTPKGSKVLKGQAYVEMTGYAEPFRKGI